MRAPSDLSFFDLLETEQMQSMMWLCFMVVSVLGSATTISDLDQVIVVDDLSDLVHQSAFFLQHKIRLEAEP